MAEGIKEVVAAIDGLPSVDTTEHLSRLQEVVDCYFSSENAAEHLGVWFRLYERFPEDDGYGVFWTILHGIEATPEYEPLIVESVRRYPSQFPLLMVNRQLNGGVRQIGGVDLLELLRQVVADERCLPGVRIDAQGFLESQQGKA
jgi:hypothetical protein